MDANTEWRIHDLLDGILELEMMLEDDGWKSWFIGDPYEHLKSMKMELAELRHIEVARE